MKHVKIVVLFVAFFLVSTLIPPISAEKPNALIIGTIVATKNNDASGAFKYEWNLYRRRWTLDLRLIENVEGVIKLRRFETWGSASGIGFDAQGNFGFDHVAIMTVYSKDQEQLVFLFGFGDVDTFQAAILPFTQENLQLFWSVFYADNRIPLIAAIIETVDDVVYGQVQTVILGD